MMRRLTLVFLALMIIAMPALATVHYLKPAAKGGSDDSLGTSAATAWATLSKIATLTPAGGDSIIIYGGIYNDQYYWRPDTSSSTGDSLKGTSMAAPIVFKAHGDTIAVFKVTGANGKRAVFDFYQGDDFVKISGIGQHHYVPTGDSLMIKIEYTGATTPTTAAIIFEGDLTIPTSRAKGNVIEGVEITGYNTSMGLTYPTGVNKGIQLWKADSTNVTSCKIQYCGQPQSSPTHNGYEGWGIDINGRFNIVSKCTLKYCGVSGVTIRDGCVLAAVGTCTTTLGISRYNQVINCVLENHWGGGVYIQDGSSHNLVKDNLITYSGGVSNESYQPAGIKMNGPRNSIQRNVIWNTAGYGLLVRSESSPPGLGYFEQRSDSNFVCNNVFFKNGLGSNVDITVNNRVQANASTISSFKGNRFINNIFYKAQGNRTGYEPVEIFFDLTWADDTGNWVTPEVLASTPTTTHWNNNSFHYNNFYSDEAHIFLWSSDERIARKVTSYTLAGMAAADTIWSSNYSYDPEFVSTRPDTTSAPANWYTTSLGSALIDAGQKRVDPIGAIVHAKNAGRAWHDLWYTGLFPDVGKEFMTPSPAIITLSADEFNMECEVGETVRDTLVVTNSAPALSDTVQLDLEVPTVMADHLTITGGDGTVLPGGTKNVIFVFTPAYSVNVGLTNLTISSDYSGLNAICPPIDLGILGNDLAVCCDVWPVSTIDFGVKPVGVYYYDTLFVGNCTDSTITVVPSLAVGTSYSLVGDDGKMDAILSGRIDTLIVRFKPMTYVVYPDTLVLTNVTCGNVVITGRGVTGGYTRPDQE
jgi:hypothetical protein